ncbi:dimethylarginine dimethylaminohydrolase family protein [Rubellimicrobium arenae]|uniref:dimethylarginine dimethylaminohydrolase family protein n=1 Tax=Rubellimicrobium arenae TaxID=2817372 RepID=UPI001B314511|nr:arginine deiminase family protein [Rubellimicrobium arenae]
MTENEWRYNQLIKIFPSEAEPSFEDEDLLTRWWGRPWGCRNDVGKLRAVLMHRPGPEIETVDTSKRLEMGAFGDIQKGWYWRGAEGPDLAGMQAQHDAYAAALEAEGVEIVRLDQVGPDRMKSCYTRDAVIGVGGGVILTRLGPRIRRGEEAQASRTLARLGCPILRTLSGTAVAEGGSFAWLNERTAVFALSSRGNEEGARQIEEVLRSQGVELIRIHLTGYRLHIDGIFLMIAPNLALINPAQLPFPFLEKLKALGIETIEVHHEDNPWIINGLAVAPRRVIITEGASNYTLDRLTARGVEVIPIPYDLMCSGGGGPHCSTAPLIRDSV